MNCILTYHAKVRSQQRAIGNEIFKCIQEHGETEYAPGGALKRSITGWKANKIIGNYKKKIRTIEKARNIAVIEKEGHVLTVKHEYKLKN